jgi:hypothetical protein
MCKFYVASSKQGIAALIKLISFKEFYGTVKEALR